MTHRPSAEGARPGTAADLAGLLDELPVLVSTWDASVRNVVANAAFRAWFAPGSVDLTGSHLGDLVQADVLDKTLPHVRTALDGGHADFDCTLAHPNGSLRHLHVVMSPRRVDGSPGFAMMCTDITDRLRAEESERRSAHEVATLMERERITERLHQEALQQLFASMLALSRRAAEDPTVALASEGIERAIDDLRAISEHHDAPAPSGEPDASAWRTNDLVGVLDKLPAAVSFWDADLRARFLNVTASRWLDCTRAGAYGQPAREVLGEELYAANESLMRAALAGEEQHFVRTLGGAGGPRRVVQFVYVPRRVEGGVDGFFVLGTDLTELIEATSTLEEARADVDRLTRAYLTLAQANQAILRAQRESELYAEVCRIAVEVGGYVGAWVGEPGPGGRVTVAAQAGALASYVEVLEITTDPDDPHGRGPTGTALREGRAVYSENFMTDPRTEPWRPEAQRHGIAASATIPLRREGVTVAALNLYSTDPTHFGDHMRRLMEGLADNVSYALTSLADRRRLESLDNGRTDP